MNFCTWWFYAIRINSRSYLNTSINQRFPLIVVKIHKTGYTSFIYPWISHWRRKGDIKGDVNVFELNHNKRSTETSKIEYLNTTRWSCRFQNCGNPIRILVLMPRTKDAKEHDSVEAIGIPSGLLNSKIVVVSLFVVIVITHPWTIFFSIATLGIFCQINFYYFASKRRRKDFSNLWPKIVKFVSAGHEEKY